MSRRLTTLVLFGLCAALGLADPPAEKPPTVREVMKKLNRGPNSVTATIGLDLKDDEPDWEAIQEQSAEYVKLTARLATHKPAKVLLVDRGLAPIERSAGRDEDYAAWLAKHPRPQVSSNLRVR